MVVDVPVLNKLVFGAMEADSLRSGDRRMIDEISQLVKRPADGGPGRSKAVGDGLSVAEG